MGKTEPLEIERPSDILRRRLIEEQNLPVSSTASLGTDAAEAHPPLAEGQLPSRDPFRRTPISRSSRTRVLEISLIDALQIAAHNSPEYQSRKEDCLCARLWASIWRVTASDISLRPERTTRSPPIHWE